MKRILLVAVALASMAFVTAPTPSQAASVGFSIRIGDRYRGAGLHFRSEPDYVVIPGTDVYYVDDLYDRDLYRYGGWWYLVDDGYWYRARSYDGPFFRIDYRSVPRYFSYVPTRYRRHWGQSSAYFRYRGGNGYYGDRYYQSRDVRYRDRDRYYDYNRDRNWNDRDRSYRTRDRNWDWNRDRDRSGNWQRDRGDRSGNWQRDRGDRSGNYRDRNRNDDQNRDQNRDQRDQDRRDRYRDRDGNDDN